MSSETWCTHGSHHSYCDECIQGPPPGADEIEAAVKAALRLAPSVADIRPAQPGVRALDVGFPTQHLADRARDAINHSLASSEWVGRVSAWVWTVGSDGDAQTDAGRLHGREIRLQPHAPD